MAEDRHRTLVVVKDGAVLVGGDETVDAVVHDRLQPRQGLALRALGGLQGGDQAGEGARQRADLVLPLDRQVQHPAVRAEGLDRGDRAMHRPGEPVRHHEGEQEGQHHQPRGQRQDLALRLGRNGQDLLRGQGKDDRRRASRPFGGIEIDPGMAHQHAAIARDPLPPLADHRAGVQRRQAMGDIARMDERRDRPVGSALDIAAIAVDDVDLAAGLDPGEHLLHKLRIIGVDHHEAEQVAGIVPDPGYHAQDLEIEVYGVEVHVRRDPGE